MPICPFYKFIVRNQFYELIQNTKIEKKAQRQILMPSKCGSFYMQKTYYTMKRMRLRISNEPVEIN